MIINKKSWHYRFIKTFKGEFNSMPSTVCSYIFSFIISMILFIAISCMLILILAGLGSIIVENSNIISDDNYILYILVCALIGIPTLISMFIIAGIAIFFIEKSELMIEYFTNKIKQSKLHKMTCREISYKESKDE